MKFHILFLSLGLIFISQTIDAQSQISLIPGVYCNGGILREYTGGGGVVLGLEYMPHQEHFFALELRTRYGFYRFDDGTSWRENKDGTLEPPIREKARLEYTLFGPQIGIVPKFYLHLDETISFFIENEFSGGIMTGHVKYNENPSAEKKLTEYIFYYCISGGMELRDDKNRSLLISIGYSTLDFKNTLKKKQPIGYQGGFPNQEACIMFNMIFKLPLNKKKVR